MQDEWRLTARLTSRRVLKQYMDYCKLKSGYALAKKAGIHPGIVNHLLREKGGRLSCSTHSAQAIEEALNAPPGHLFELKMSRVADASRQPEKSAA